MLIHISLTDHSLPVAKLTLPKNMNNNSITCANQAAIILCWCRSTPPCVWCYTIISSGLIQLVAGPIFCLPASPLTDFICPQHAYNYWRHNNNWCDVIYNISGLDGVKKCNLYFHSRLTDKYCVAGWMRRHLPKFSHLTCCRQRRRRVGMNLERALRLMEK